MLKSRPPAPAIAKTQKLDELSKIYVPLSRNTPQMAEELKDAFKEFFGIPDAPPEIAYLRVARVN